MIRTFISVFFIACLLFAPVAHAEGENWAQAPSPQLDRVEALQRRITEMEQKIATLEAEITRLRGEIEHYQFLREDTRQYRQFIEHEQSAFKDFLERLIQNAKMVITTIVGVGGVIAVFLGIQTLRDIRREATDAVKKETEKIRSEANRQIQRAAREAVEGVQERVTVLDEILQRELWRRRVRVVATGRAQDLDALDPAVFQLLRRQGIQISAMPIPEKMHALEQSLQNGAIDILVYYWHPELETQQDPLLDQLMHTMTEHGFQVPVLIYSDSGRVTGQNEKNVARYGYGTYANSRLTLVTNLNALIPTFGRRYSDNTPSVSGGHPAAEQV